ncbi:hypothetical protein M2G40_00335 [Vibrio vulnificus]|uniref:hypothetical protein n=1 Tax=Vibrio vulnificus TaxID=672 RepID=UPI0013023995|nr:hypothetical protein [Vibrio vulnificus]MCU8488795.1 hypothetical protein [Vibrio vulnificus]MCU8506226.1 hypothetical protein [Vibrio vulnificus]
MLVCAYREDGSDCTTEMYEYDPGKYRGLIDCKVCGEKAWFVKGYKTEKIDRMACFGARHATGCDASTVLMKPDGEDESAGEGDLSSDIRVDLDKANNNSLYVSQDNGKHGEEESTRVAARPASGVGSGSGFPLNKSLRALLTNLCRNPNYADKGQTINIVTDGGREIIKGQLSDFLVPISEASDKHTGKEYIFWGPINNLNIDKNGVLWLNYGDYRTEPSISLRPELKDQLLRNFKIKDVGELDGSDVIVVGHVGISPNNKAIISTGFTKYLSFRKMNVVAEDEAAKEEHSNSGFY